jgi:nuclear transport factor 2 (NTF2) superfamily protein
MFHRSEIDALVHGFTEDCVVRFAEQPERRGRQALRELFTARLARQKNYRLKKTLLGLDRDVLANVWEGTWEDRDSGIPLGFSPRVPVVSLAAGMLLYKCRMALAKTRS